MRIIAIAAPVALAMAMSSCTTHHPAESSEPSVITQLDEGQVNELIPYMVERRKVGELESHVTEAADESFTVSFHRQAYRFELWIDAQGYPVMPPKDGDSRALMGRASLHEGSFEVACQSICQWPAPGANISCAMSGCQPISDSTCGCTPQDCGNCVPLGCGAFVRGFLAGRLVML